MSNWRRWIKGNGVAGEAATLMGGTVAAQAIALLAYLVLTRLYTPEDFALFNIFYSYIEVLIIVSTCKYELATVVAKDPAEGAAVARFALRMNTWVSLLLLAGATVLYMTHSLPGNYAELGAVALLVPPMVWLCGSSRIYAGLYNRVRRYKVMAASEVTNSGTGAMMKVLLGVLGWRQVGLPLGTILGQAAANMVYRLRMHSLQLPKTTRAQRKAAAWEYKNYPLYVAPKEFINSLSANLPFLWLAFYFDKAEVGLFGLALTMTFRPANILHRTLESVLYARASEKVRAGESIARLTGRSLLAVNAAALPVCVVGWFVAEPTFTFLFGPKWEGCGVYVQALLPWIFLSLNATPLTFLSNIFNKQRTEFLFYIGLLALRASAIAVGIHVGDFLTAVRLYAGVSALTMLALAAWYAALVRRYETSVKQRFSQR